MDKRTWENANDFKYQPRKCFKVEICEWRNKKKRKKEKEKKIHIILTLKSTYLNILFPYHGVDIELFEKVDGVIEWFSKYALRISMGKLKYLIPRLPLLIRI